MTSFDFGHAAPRHDLTARFLSMISGFVEQEDTLLETMTVEEAIQMSTILRAPDLTKDQRTTRLESVLTLLNLHKCRKTIIGSKIRKGISGGEKKRYLVLVTSRIRCGLSFTRTSIAMELVANPSILFLDEPTSGLDAFTQLSVAKLLRRIARMGHTVVATIHNPSAEMLALFDQLLILVEGRVSAPGNSLSFSYSF